MYSKSEISYRRSAIEGASPIGLVIVLFDRLIADLQRAASALRANDIEGRCRQCNHALLVLAQLESWLDMKYESAKLIALFYAQIRLAMLEAAAEKQPAILEKQIENLLLVRSSWHVLDQPMPVMSEAATQEVVAASMSFLESQPERARFSLSA